MADTPDIDPSLLADFISEGLETLDGLDPLFVQLEANPDDESIVDGIFRPVHSVKGNSGFFGLHNIKNFAHVMENLLGEIRNRKRKATPDLVDLLLKGVDFLRGMMNRLGQGNLSGDFIPEEEAHLRLLEAANRPQATGGAAGQGSAQAPADDGRLADLVEAVKALYGEYVASIDDNGLAQLGEAVKALHAHVFPPPAPPGTGGQARYSLGDQDLTGPVATAAAFVGDIGRLQADEASCEAFRAAAKAIVDAAQAHDAQPVLAAAATMLDEFETLQASGIGFDDLMQSLLRERLEAALAGLVRRGANPLLAVPDAAPLGPADAKPALEAVSEFLSGVSAACRDEAAVVAFSTRLADLRRLAEDAGHRKAAAAVTSLADDFGTLRQAGIGVDGLMAQLLAEKFSALVQAIAGGPAAAEPGAAQAAGGAAGGAGAGAGAGDAAKPAAGVAAGAAGAAAKAAAPMEGGKTIRVAEEKVDSFMNFVGELIITGEVFSYIQKKLDKVPEARSVSQEFKNANLSFNELSGNLQRSLMEVRRVPLKSVMQKLPRIVRDTATQLGKHMDFNMQGEDCQIDKSLLEGLESPLVHMVRNSVDHGVEAPEARKAAGKPEKGTVTITAQATEEQFTLTIQDDGKGLDVEALKAKAVAKGVLTEEAARALPDRDAFRLVFHAGLSTAKVVTDVSGRGVGMDVVMSNITRMGGQIQIESAAGKGSTFTILLPMTVTLAVIDGLVARIGSEQYIVPLSEVRESVRPEGRQLHTIRGSQNEVLDVRGVLYPLLRLSRLLGVRGPATEDPTAATVILVEGRHGGHGALMVDELVGQQSIVVKDLGKQFQGLRCIQGASILGDARVGLVLDVNGILEATGAQAGDES